MEKQMTFSQYRSFDLVALALAYALCETLIVKAASSWFPAAPYTLSLASALTAIVYMRWGFLGLPYALFTGFVYCLASGGDGDHYLVYMVGNLLSGLILLLRGRVGHQKIRDDAFTSIVFAVLVALLMQVGRAMMVLILVGGLGNAVRMMATDFLSGFFAAVVIFIARRQDGLFEDQKSYLLRINREEEA